MTSKMLMVMVGLCGTLAALKAQRENFASYVHTAATAVGAFYDEIAKKGGLRGSGVERDPS
ncbi:MAG TPA: hypothetical protein VG122_04360 [Gemmata sp.]|jgi:hypothetical protein|nr:hypothetical protein [Gemmata sp.]